MGRKRSNKKWLLNFKSAKRLMDTLDLCDNLDELENLSTLLRNPIIFDNNVSDVKSIIPYTIPNGIFYDIKKTEDHLIGMGNMVLYIYKYKLHKSWETVEDFKSTLKSLNILMIIPKKLNDNGKFKGCQFNYHNIDDSIRWNNKFKSVGITHLVCNESDKMVHVDVVWDKWYKTFK